MSTITRFAPSPTGQLHLGHAYSALFAANAANRDNGAFVVRIEDIDPGRCKPEFEAQIFEDLNWLGLQWALPVRRQSEHMEDYEAALQQLSDMGMLYPCFCSRSDIKHEIESSGQAPHSGPDGPHYPGTCRILSKDQQQERKAAGNAFALRLSMDKAIQHTGPLSWHDGEQGEIVATPEIFGDVVLARKETPTSYHLAVTIDDHLQGITLVTRGQDLFHASHIHTILQKLLGLNQPQYHHHKLLKDESGQRFAKRDDAATLSSMRQSGITPEEIRMQLGFKK